MRDDAKEKCIFVSNIIPHQQETDTEEQLKKRKRKQTKEEQEEEYWTHPNNMVRA